MPEREIFDHKVPGKDHSACESVVALDEPGSGGANHEYAIRLEGDVADTRISFQNGPVGEVGVNGISNEALIAIVLDRMRGFGSGPFHCHENSVVVTKLEEALMWCQKRTRDRLARGVEGASKA